MNKVITPLLRVLIKLFAFIIFVFVVGCEKEEIINILDDSSVNSEGDFNITEVSYEEFKTDSIYHELAVAIESKFNKKEHLISKNDSLLYDYNILTDKVIKVSEANNYVSYTFEILNPNQPKYTFDNYIIRRKGGELIEEYIVRYEYDLLNYIKGDENAYTARAVFDLNYNPIFDKGDKNLSSKIIYSNGCMMNIDMYHYTPERRWFLYTDGSTCHFPGRCEVTLVIDVNCPITSSGGGGAGGGSDPGDPSFPGNPSGGGDPVNQSGVIDTPLGPATALEVESSLAFKIYYLLDRGLNYYRYSWLNSHPVESVQLLRYLTENTNPTTLKATSQAREFALEAMDAMINEEYVVSFSPLIKYPKGSNYQNIYPKLTEYLKNQLPKVGDNPKIVNAIKNITGLSAEQIKEDLKWNHGPTLNIVQLNNFALNTSHKTTGAFSVNTPDDIYLDIDYVRALEQNINDQGIEDAWLFYIGTTILHEYVHYGDNMDGIDYPGEEGILFELAVYGQDVHSTNAMLILNKK